MAIIEHDENGFTCECGKRNEYPSYVQEHWAVKLNFACACNRQYILYRGTVTKTSGTPGTTEVEGFGD